uniref:Scaffolding protein n=1 Tax=Podoviridae sp. ctFbF42 TaxID=2825233 RepID=A0A8S5PXC0_9CAUD|nr:MAG TPA: Scaffolding protein [Podoviridae sp. ctFbF42]
MTNGEQTVDTVTENTPSPASAEPSTLDSVEDIVSALDGYDNAAGGNAGDETEPKSGEQPDDAGQDGKDEGQEQPAAPAEPAEVPMPEGFNADTWGKLAPDARSAVHAMAETHAQAMAQERQTVLNERADRDNQINAAATLLGQANQLIEAIVNAEYSGIDWQALSEQNPSEYIRLAREVQKRTDAVQALGARIRQTAQAVEAKRAQEYQQALSAEYQTVEPKIRALIGNGYDGKTYTAEVYQYMKDAGVPDKAINSLSKGYELELVTKAMLYDKMEKARAAAEKKVAEAPKVQAPSGVKDGTASVQKQAFARFYKNPNSTDALAAALAAMD